MSGKLIVLNGTSSSGKTSIARCLQANWPTPLLYVALDAVIAMMPFAYTGTGLLAADGYCLKPAMVNGDTVVDYSLGRHARFLNSNLATLADSLSAGGYDVIIDHIITDDETMVDLIERVRNRPTFLIGVVCDKDICGERERSREDRMIGLAAGQSPKVHSGLRPYDLIVDSTHATPEVLAETIRRFVDDNLPRMFGKAGA